MKRIYFKHKSHATSSMKLIIGLFFISILSIVLILPVSSQKYRQEKGKKNTISTVGKNINSSKEPILTQLKSDYNSDIGFHFLKNFTTDEYGGHGQNFDAIEDDRGVMYFANFAGVIEFDGTNWRLMTTKNITRVNVLAKDNKGRIFVGARGEIGYLKPDNKGELKFADLTEKLTKEEKQFRDVLALFPIERGTYVVTDNRILFWDNFKFYSWKPKGEILSAYYLNGKLYFLEKGAGLNIFDEKGKFVNIASTELFSETVEIKAMIQFSSKTPNDKIIIGTENSGLFILKDKDITKWNCDADLLLRENTITCGVSLNGGNIAFGTSRVGMIVVSESGEIKEVINDRSGLKDNYVNNIYPSSDRGVWLSLNNGISRIERDNGYTYFNEKCGLKGEVNKIIRYKSRLYLATLEGLGYISNQNYQPTVNWIKEIRIACWDLSVIKEELFAATSNGIYKIIGDIAERIGGGFTLTFSAAGLNQEIIFAGYTDGLGYFIYEKGKWIEKGRISGITEEIRGIYPDNNGWVWLETPSAGVVRFKLDDFNKIEKLNATNGLQSPFGNGLCKIGNNIYITNESGIFEFDENNAKIKKVDILHKDTNTNKDIWIGKIWQEKTGNLWTVEGNNKNVTNYILKADKYEKNSTPFLPISGFSLKTIGFDENKIVWFGGPDGVIRFDANFNVDYKRKYNALIRKIVINNDKVHFSGVFTDGKDNILKSQPENSIPVFNPEERTMLFDYSATSYEIMGSLSFQYMLEGFDNGWSELTKEPKKEYTNLSPGTYKFRVRAVNVYGNMSNEASYEFVILRPWYTTWWAYVLYALGLIFGVVFIVRLRSKQLEKEKHALEAIVEERTSEVVKQKEELELQSEQLSLKNEELEKINIIVKAINNEINFAMLLNTILEKTRVIKGVERATALVNVGNDVYRFKASYGCDVSEVEDVKLSFEEVELRYLKDSEEIYEDIFYNGNFNPSTSHEKLDLMERPISILIILVKIEGKIEGIILLENMKLKYAFGENDLSLIKNLKEHIIAAFIKTKILEDLQITLDNLKAAQQQLVQSEKLASLGQLTAGIAHEIQNPLNFVNNFSSLSVDMLAELREELEKEKDKLGDDDYDNLVDIVRILDENVGKITEHGKRAERIVKGMLMHSRGKSGEFQMTELNTMVQEYVNLAYHGMRAQDHEFNTKFDTSYDSTIGKLNIVPQDLSRVILNIVNNACYAVNEKAKKLGSEFSPVISITTQKLDESVKIVIRDNGTGIPQSVIDKIFQPFYTTKPTGKGTGLGLSMSYDIVTQIHRGILEVKSEPGEWTEFVIIIPTNLK